MELTLLQLFQRFKISKGIAGCPPWPDLNASMPSKTAEPSCKGDDKSALPSCTQSWSAAADCRQAREILGRQAYRNVLVDGAGTVDELDDRVRVVNKVSGQGLVGEVIAIGCDEGSEVVGDFACCVVAHAVGGCTLGSPNTTPGSGSCGCSECKSCECENGTHVGNNGIVLVVVGG